VASREVLAVFGRSIMVQAPPGDHDELLPRLATTADGGRIVKVTGDFYRNTEWR